jgi:hypothetical protein
MPPRKVVKRKTKAPRTKAKARVRSTGCTPEKVAIIARLAALGYLANEIADILGVTRMTMWRWRAMEPGVSKALSIGHESANARVELSVYQMAIGYDREEEEIKVIDGEVVRVPVTRYYPPNPTAAAFWARHKMGWGEDAPPPNPADEPSKPVEVRQVARQVARLLHLANKPEQ